MQSDDLNELLKTAAKLEAGFDVEVYISPKTRKARIINAVYVLCGFALLGLMVAMPAWWQRLICACAFVLAAFAFDRDSRVRWR
jgi:hypothetical protein